MELRPLPNIMEDTLKENGYDIESVSSINEVLNSEFKNHIAILPSYYFSPKSYQTGEINKTKETHSIHHFAASWVNPYDNLSLYAKIWKFFHLPDTKIREKLFGKH